MRYGIFSMRWASALRGSVSGSGDFCCNKLLLFKQFVLCIIGVLNFPLVFLQLRLRTCCGCPLRSRRLRSENIPHIPLLQGTPYPHTLPINASISVPWAHRPRTRPFQDLAEMLGPGNLQFEHRSSPFWSESRFCCHWHHVNRCGPHKLTAAC